MTTPPSLPTLTRTHGLVMRACYAHGEQGDWDIDAIKRHLVNSDGLSPEAADAAIDICVSDGVLIIDTPPSATILPFVPRSGKV